MLECGLQNTRSEDLTGSLLSLVKVLSSLFRAKTVRRGQLPSKVDLTTKPLACIEHLNQEKQILQWAKPADTIVRACSSQTRH